MRITNYLSVKDPKKADREKLKEALKKTPDFKDVRDADKKIDELLDSYDVPKRIPKEDKSTNESKGVDADSGRGDFKSKRGNRKPSKG